MSHGHMQRERLTAALVAVALCVTPAAPASAQAARASSRRGPSSRAGIAVGDITWTDREVTRAAPPDKSVWKPVALADKLRTGDTLRTGEDAVAVVVFPWMDVSLGPSSMLTIPATAVLSTVLEQGRAELAGAGRDIVKIVVGSAEVRGGGRVVLRRSSGRTTISALAGGFRVRASGRLVEVRAGQGTFVRDGAPPTPAAPLPAAPSGLRPGAEVGYVRSGRGLDLRWTTKAAGFHVALLPLGSERILLARETSAASARLELPWLGTYRWRVSARDERGLESGPSEEGLICVVER